MFKVKLSIKALFLALVLITLHLLTMPSANLHAQFSGFGCEGVSPVSTENAKQEILKAQNWYSKNQNLTADFLQHSYLSALDISEKSSGKVYLKKPGLMRWVYEKPEAQDFLVKSNTYWLYRPADQQVLVDNFNEVLISDLPVAFLMGLGDLTKDFTVQRGCKKEADTIIEMLPKAKKEDLPVSSSELQNFVLILGSQGEPKGAQVVDIAGNVTTMKLEKIDSQTLIDSSRFNEKFPSNADIYDRRNEE